MQTLKGACRVLASRPRTVHGHIWTPPRSALISLMMTTALKPEDEPPRPLLSVFQKNLQWLAAKALGLLLCVPMTLQLGVKMALRPDKVFKPYTPKPLPDPLPGLIHEWVVVNGNRLHLVRTCTNADGTKPVLILLHGFPEGWFSWRRQMEVLPEEGWCVVAMDLRGYGGSDKPQGVGSYTAAELASDVAGVIKAIAPPSTGRVTLAGHDWGGLVAWNVAHHYPELIEKLAVMCAPHPGRYLPNLDWDQAKRSWYILAFQTPWIPEAVLRWDGCAMVARMLAEPPMGCKNPGALTKEDLERYKQAFALPGAATAAVNYYRAALQSMLSNNTDARRAFEQKLQMPVLLLWADGDVALGPQLLQGMERCADRLRVHIVRDSSHWVQQDRWQEVNSLMVEFLGEK